MTYIEMDPGAQDYLEVLASSAFRHDEPKYTISGGILVVPQSNSPKVLEIMARVAVDNPYVQVLPTDDGREAYLYPLSYEDYLAEYAEDCTMSI